MGHCKKQTIIFLIILGCVTTLFLTEPLLGLDEIWDYNYARGIAMGYIPYSDFNMIQMPLFFMLMALPLKITQSLLIYRIESALFFSILLFIFNLLLNKRISDRLALAITIIVLLSTYKMITYNTMILLCALVLLLIHTKSSEHSKDSLFIGLVVATAIMFRQTTGCILLIGEIFALVKILKKGTVKKRAFEFLIGFSIPCFILLSYLLINKNFIDFWDNCLFSLLKFGSRTGTVSLYPLDIIYLIYILAIIIWSGFKFYTTKNIMLLYKLILILELFTIALPIVDEGHLFPAALLCTIILFDIVDFSNINASQSFITTIVVLFLLTVPLVAFKNIKNSNYIKHSEMKNIPLTFSLDEFENINSRVADYNALGYKTEIISECKALFSIMNDSFDAPYDFSGMDDPLGYVKKLDEGTVIIISNSYKEDNWQNPPQVFDYIVENYILVDYYEGYYFFYIGNN